MIQQERIQPLNSQFPRHRAYVLYWMQASQRAECNHALEYAIRRANEMRQPLLVYFGLADRFPEAQERHYRFLLEGLSEVQTSLEDRGVKMVVRHESPEWGATALAQEASLVVTDRGYLRIQKGWRRQAAERIDCSMIQVESDVIVPVETASPKEQYSAATLRPKILSHLDSFLRPMEESEPKIPSLSLDLDSLAMNDLQPLLSRLDTGREVGKTDFFQGGTHEAKRRLQRFTESCLDEYPEKRNDPTLDALSHMSPYLHFGQISPLYIALQIKGTDSPGTASYLEELIVRRELSMNFVSYNSLYDAWEGLPDWTRRTLKAHEGDLREYIYSLKELEDGGTHDPYWNAAQKEMALTGKMHGYMRMYWGKKILEWSRTPEEAFKAALYLNNKYELDGRDPNGYAGVAWCFGKHDRPWGERGIFGTVRYMNERGLRRKFDADAYVERVRGYRWEAPDG